MIILDTNVVSELWRPRPSLSVVTWIDSKPANTVFLCTPVLAEMRYGVEMLPDGPRKDRLRALVDRLEAETYRDRVLPFDAAASHEFGRLAAERKRAGRRIEPMDAMVAAITATWRATLATRDVSDFTGLGLDVVNPFEAE